MDVNLDNFPEYLHKLNQSSCNEWPAAKVTHAFVEDVVDFLFPFRTNINYTVKEFKLQPQQRVLFAQSVGYPENS